MKENKLAELYLLTMLPWQYFGTLTFCEPFLRGRETGFANQRRMSLYNEFGRRISGRLNYSCRKWGCGIDARRQLPALEKLGVDSDVLEIGDHVLHARDAD